MARQHTAQYGRGLYLLCPPNPFEAIGRAAARFNPATVPSSGTPMLDLEICGELPPMKRGSEGLVIGDQ